MNTDIIIAILGSGALSTIISAIIAAINNRIKSTKGINKALQMLMLDSIECEGERLLFQGKLTMQEFKRFKEKYDCYKALGGDGYAEAIMGKINSLPTDTE